MNLLPLSDELLWEIVDLLDDGEVVYLHRETHDLHSHPDPKRWDTPDVNELMDEVKSKVDEAPGAYFVLEPPEPQEAFYVMEAFLNTVEDAVLKQQLETALRSKKPFRYFRTAVEDSPLREDWFDYKDAWMKIWVNDKLENMQKNP